MEQLREKLKGKELIGFSIFTMILLFVAAFLSDTPADIGKGMITIVLSRDTLITDYFELACYGAAFFNAALVLGSAIWMMYRLKMHFTGLTMAVLFINVGFALFGKNPLNVMPIIIGTWLYARVHKAPMSRYIYTALFGSCFITAGNGNGIFTSFFLWCQFVFGNYNRHLCRLYSAAPCTTYGIYAYGL